MGLSEQSTSISLLITSCPILLIWSLSLHWLMSVCYCSVSNYPGSSLKPSCKCLDDVKSYKAFIEISSLKSQWCVFSLHLTLLSSLQRWKISLNQRMTVCKTHSDIWMRDLQCLSRCAFLNKIDFPNGLGQVIAFDKNTEKIDWVLWRAKYAVCKE